MSPWVVALAALPLWAIPYYWNWTRISKIQAKGQEMLVMTEMRMVENSEFGLVELMNMYPASPIPARRWAERMVEVGSWDEALRRVDIVRKKFPRDPVPYVVEVRALTGKREFDLAEIQAQAGMRRFPKVVAMFEEFAKIAAQRGDLQEAQRRWSDLRRGFPHHPWGYFYEVQGLVRLGDLAAADQVCETALTALNEKDQRLIMLEYAGIAVRRGDVEESVRRFARAREVCGEDPGILVGLTRSLRQAGRTEEAQEVFAAALHRFPADSEVVRLRRETEESANPEPESKAGDEVAGAPDKTENAAPSVQPDPSPEIAVERPPDPGPSEEIRRLMDAAAEAVARGDISTANQYWQDARAERNAPIDAWLLPARDRGVAPRPENASELLEEALTRFPGNGLPLHDLARLQERRGDFPAAERSWRAFLEIDGDRGWAYSALSSVLRAQGRQDEADAVLERGAARLPDDLHIAAESAHAAQARQDWDKANEIWDKTIARAPDSWIGYRGKIATLQQSGRSAEAEELLRVEAAKLPSNTDALHDVARSAEQRGDWPGAEAAWRSFLAVETRVDWAYLAFAAVLSKQGKLEEAEKVLSDGLQRFPCDVSLAIDASRCSEERGDWTTAAARWRMVAKLRPDHPDAASREANALRQAGLSDANMT